MGALSEGQSCALGALTSEKSLDSPRLEGTLLWAPCSVPAPGKLVLCVGLLSIVGQQCCWQETWPGACSWQ